MEITLKLVLQSIELQNQVEKEQQIEGLNFILTNFLMVPNFDQIEKESAQI